MEPSLTTPEETTKAPKQVSGGEVMLNMESMIKNYYNSTQELKEKIKKMNEMFQDFFINDSTYAQHKEANKQTAAVLKATKAEIMKKTQVYQMSLELKGLKQELKENKSAMSDYLAEYARMSGVTEIEVADGTMLKITAEYKLKPVQLRMF